MRLRKQYKYSPSDFDIASYKFFYHGGIFFVLIVLVRLFELYLLIQNHIISSDLLKFTATGVFYDLIYTLQIGGILLIPYLVLYNISRILGIVFYSASLSLVVLFSFMFSFYFAARSIPVDYHIFEGGLIQQLSPYINATIFFAGCIILIIFGLGMVWLVRNLRIPRLYYFLIYCIAILSLVFYFRLFPNPKIFYSELNYYTTINKPNYLLYSALSSRFSNSTNNYAYSYNFDTDSSHFREGKLNMVSSNYPFLRPKDSIPMLEKYFTSGKKPPTLIIIVVENLSRTFSGQHATLGSYSPFLDSMNSRGLNWENFLSNSLDPLASLHVILNSSFPCNAGQSTGRYFSIIDILRRNNYPDYFYSNLNAMPAGSGSSIKQSNFTRVFLNDKLGSDNTPNSFYNSLSRILPSYSNTPSVHVIYQAYQAVEKESKEFKKYIAGFQKKGIDNTANSKYHQWVNYIFETDKGLSQLYVKLTNSGVLNNSILIITGANHPISVPLDNRIRKYYVPLIMLSSLIKNSHEFHGISTHMNISPSLAAYFEYQYGFRMPDYLPFSGAELSDNMLLSSQNSIPFEGLSGQVNEYLYYNMFYSQGHLYKVLNQMGLREVNNEDILQQTRSLLGEYNTAKDYVCRQNKIMPDTLRNY